VPDARTPSSPGPDVDALREKLRALGYLDAGVDRYVLGSARTDRGVGALAWHASLRIGALAGVLVGVSGALGVAIRLPALVTGLRDALVVAVCLGLLFGVVTAVAAFVVTIAASRVARSRRAGAWVVPRARRAALAAGALVGLACLAYLTLWWRATGVAAVGGSALATGLAVVVAATISLLLGYSTAVTAQAVLAVAPGGEAPLHRVRLSWRTAGLLAVACMASAAALLIATTRSPAQSVAAARLVVVPTGVRLLVIGVDGFDPRFARDLAATGRLPAIGPLVGGPALSMPREAAWDPVPVWASIATGQPPARHGAVALESRRVAGLAGRVPGNVQGLAPVLAATTDLLRLTRPVVSSGAEREEPAFWEVASRAGLRTAVVNWWTTWPATPRDGDVVVTERASLRLQHGGTQAAEISPAALYDLLLEAWPAIATDARAEAARAARDLPPVVASVVAQAIEVDATQAALAVRAASCSADLIAVYLPGLDIAQAALQAATVAPASGLAERLRGIERVYTALDEIAGRLRRACPGHAIVFVAHPGRVKEAQDVQALMAVDLAGTERRADASATASAPRPAASQGTLLDVAPTILALLGVPLSQELPGRWRPELVPADFAAQHSPRTVASYGRRARAGQDLPGGARPLEDEMRDRLRSLGYVQ
jgi:hypothetical protein